MHKILPYSFHRTKEGDNWRYMISNKTLKIEKEKRKKKRVVTLSPTLSYQPYINNHMLIPKISTENPKR